MGGGTATEYVLEDSNVDGKKLKLSTGYEVFYDFLENEPEYDDLVDFKGLQEGGAYFAKYLTNHEDTVKIDDVVYVPEPVILEAEEKLSSLKEDNYDRFRGQLGTGLAFTVLGVTEFLNGNTTTGIGLTTTGVGLTGHYVTDKAEQHYSEKVLQDALSEYIKLDGGEDVVFNQINQVREELKATNHRNFEE